MPIPQNVQHEYSSIRANRPITWQWAVAVHQAEILVQMACLGSYKTALLLAKLS
jgi:hypothetical protein